MLSSIHAFHTHLKNSETIAERGQHYSLLISVPVEFSAFVYEFWVSGTFVFTDVGRREDASDSSLVDHGNYGYAQTFTNQHSTEEAEECHDVVDQCTPRNIELRNRLILHWC